MMKQLQLYTIIIVIIVIVLSQFSFQNKTNVSSKGNNSENSALINNTLPDSKYSEPIRETLNAINETKGSVNKVKMEINRLKRFLDIEENIKELNNLME